MKGNYEVYYGQFSCVQSKKRHPASDVTPQDFLPREKSAVLAVFRAMENGRLLESYALEILV